MANGKKPEIQADALLNLVLDVESLKRQLGPALGTTIKEAASAANLGDKLLSPKALTELRHKLKDTFQTAGQDLGEALNLSQSKGLEELLSKTRRDTVKQFKSDMASLLSGKESRAAKGRGALPTLKSGDTLRAELERAIRTFGNDSLRSGSYSSREPEILKAQQVVGQINKVLTELAGLPAVAAADLQKLRRVVNDKDTGKYLKLQSTERQNLARSGQALSLQTQNLERLASSLSKLGFGDVATDIKAANQARRQLVSEFNKLTSPANIEARARQEKLGEAKAEVTQAGRNRRDLKNEIKQREAEQRARGSYQTVVGTRRAGKPSPGILATMDDATRARLGYKPREDYRAASLSGIRGRNEASAVEALKAQEKVNASRRKAEEAQMVAQAAHLKKQRDDTAKYNEEIRKQGDRQLTAQSEHEKKKRDAEVKHQEEALKRATANNEAQEQLRAASGKAGSSYADAKRVIGLRGGIGNLKDEIDIGIVRSGLGNAYRQSQQRLGVAGSVHGESSPQYASALAELTRVRGERDSLAEQIRVNRAERVSANGGSARNHGKPDRPEGPGGTERLASQFARYAVGYGALYGLLGLVMQLKTEIIALDKAFFSIKAVTQATDIEMKSISRSIREVALNTNFTTTEIAGATEILGQAGVAPAELGKVLSSTAKFASATNSSLAVAADLLTTVRTVFSTMDDSTIANQLTKAINLSKLTAEDLKTILSLTSQTAASYNINLEQLLAASTTLRNAGIKPSTVATGMRQALLEVFNPDTATMKALQKRYAEMGEEITSGGISQRFFGFTNAENPLIAALTELKRVGFTDEGQKTLQRGVDIRAFNAIQGLLANFKELEEAESKITFGQAAAEGAEIQMESLSASLENLGSSVVVLAEQLSGGLVRGLAAGAQGATDLIEKLSELDLELQASGLGSLNEVLAGVAAGAATGIAAGKGFKGKVAGAVVGATAGGYLSGGAALDTEGGFGVGDAAGLAASALALGSFFKWVSGMVRALKPLSTAVSVVEAGSVLTSGAAAAGIGIKFIPVIGWLSTAFFAIETLYDLLPEDESAKIRAKAEAASAQAAKISSRLTENTQLVDDFDPNSANPKDGTASAGFAKYRSQMESFKLGLEETFGSIVVGKEAEVTTLLKQYANTAGSQRGVVRAEIERVLGSVIPKAIDDKILFDLGGQRTAVEATVAAFVDNTRQTITAVTERIRAARESGDSISEKDQALSDAFSENSAELLAILDGDSGFSPEETQEKLKAYYARFVELVDKRPALKAEESVKLLNALSDQLTAALASSDNSAEIALAVSQIGNSLEYLGLSVERRIGGILRGIQGSRASIEAELAQKEKEGPGIMQRAAIMFSGGAAAGIETPEDVARKARIAELRARLVDLDVQEKGQNELLVTTQKKRETDSAASKEKIATQASSLITGFNSNADISAALDNDKVLREILPDNSQRDFLKRNVAGIRSGDPALLARLASTTQTADGPVKPSAELTQLEAIFGQIAANLNRVTKAEERKVRDEKNLVGIDLLTQQSKAGTDIKKAEAGKQYGLLGSDSPDNPVVQKFAAEKLILEKELAKAKANADDAGEDGSKNAVDLQQKVLEVQAKLDTLSLDKDAQLAGFQAKGKTAGEQAQRKSDAEAKKQATIKVTQTGIAQRIVKQDFDEAIRVGNSETFLNKSKEYEEVQARLRNQLEEELKARGYTTSQILDEIKLREDLNKPLAEQVDNIRKLAAQQSQMLDLKYRDIGTGPNLGSKEQTAYLGADGFTREELAAADLRDLQGLGDKRVEKLKQLNDPALQGDQETLSKLNAELDDLDTQVGETKRNLMDLTADAPGSIYEAFSPRQLIIELENTQFSFANLGENLRGGLVNALDEAGDALARLVTEGGDVKDVLSDIALQFAQEELAMMFKTNLREGVTGLVKGASGTDGGEGGLGGVVSAAGRGIEQLFGFGDVAKPGANAAGTPEAAKGGGFFSTVASFLGIGGADPAVAGALPGAATATATMNVSAGVVNVGGGVPGIPDLGGLPATGAGGDLKGVIEGLGDSVPKAVGDGLKPETEGFFASLGSGISGLMSSAVSTISGWFGGGAEVPTPDAGGGGLGGLAGGGTPPAAAAGGFKGAAMGALGGAGMGASLGGAIGGKKGRNWGALAGALAGAYFGMAGGGRISKSGMVLGSGRRGVDSVPVSVKGTGQQGLLAPGESVLNLKATDALGADWVDSANSGKLFRKAVGGAIDGSYNATQRAQASAANSVANTGGGSPGATAVNLKNVNVFDGPAIRSAMQTREGEDMMINVLKKRGAI